MGRLPTRIYEMQLTREQIQKDLNALPAHYKTADVDRLIRRYVKQKRMCPHCVRTSLRSSNSIGFISMCPSTKSRM